MIYKPPKGAAFGPGSRGAGLGVLAGFVHRGVLDAVSFVAVVGVHCPASFLSALGGFSTGSGFFPLDCLYITRFFSVFQLTYYTDISCIFVYILHLYFV